tara:strand:- start:6308 stop:7591 length:1284 start_codon:yes stop_codon:yes gene_type:complete
MKAKVISLLGLQWGDEGKGKVVDQISKDISAAVRYQGGHNAGHTLIVKDKTIVFHLLPSAICHENIKCFLGRGVVVSLDALFEELKDASEIIDNVESKLVVSPACSLIQPYHIKLDQLKEKSKSSTTIGTTGRGIGTAYEDRVGRRAIRAGDLYNEATLRDKLKEALDYYNFLFTKLYNEKKIDFNLLYEKNLIQGEKLKPLIGNVVTEIKKLIEDKKSVLFEGAQGALLDVSLGTYPFVTSSNLIGGISSGVGINPSSIDYSLGIAKAYTTRVGEGPFPTELTDSIGDFLAKKGGEVGATTGRKRRCGWLDAVLLKHVVYLNGINGICLTKIDVLDGLDKIKVCTDYKSNLPLEDVLELMALEDVEPIYSVFEGWEEPTFGLNKFEDLNKNARDYISAIEEICGAPVVMISTGPKREDTIVRESLI